MTTAGDLGSPVDLAIIGPVAVVSLHAPPLNIFNVAMRDELINALRAVDDIDDVRAMVLRAEGRHFCAGADLSEFGQADSIMEGRRIRWDRDPWGRLWDLRVPTVAALHGTALGSGLEMSLLCDIRLAAPDAVLGLPETKLGMLPAAGGTQSLTAAVGAHAALALVASGEPIEASEGLRVGLIHQVADHVDDAAMAVAQQLALLEPVAVRAARRAVRAAYDLPLDAGLAYEKRLATGLKMGTDARSRNRPLM